MGGIHPTGGHELSLLIRSLSLPSWVSRCPWARTLTLTAPDELAVVLHACLRRRCVNVCMNRFKVLWLKRLPNAVNVNVAWGWGRRAPWWGSTTCVGRRVSACHCSEPEWEEGRTPAQASSLWHFWPFQALPPPQWSPSPPSGPGEGNKDTWKSEIYITVFLNGVGKR